jgi:hypothetical protein
MKEGVTKRTKVMGQSSKYDELPQENTQEDQSY